MPVDVLYEDERLLAVRKLPGQLVIPGRGKDEAPTLQQLAASACGERLFVVHRLDREASGLVVFAKDAPTHKRLCQAFESRSAHKTYLAVVVGRMEGEGRLDAPIRAYGSGRMGAVRDGKASLTLYKSLSSRDGASLLEVGLVTGRRHQIRVHLYGAGHSIIGDPLYGRSRPAGGGTRLLLHAWKLSLPGEKELACPPDEGFIAACARLGFSAEIALLPSRARRI